MTPYLESGANSPKPPFPVVVFSQKFSRLRGWYLAAPAMRIPVRLYQPLVEEIRFPADIGGPLPFLENHLLIPVSRF